MQRMAAKENIVLDGQGGFKVADSSDLGGKAWKLGAVALLWVHGF